MAKSLGRRLEPWEHVHHLNGVKDDNRLGNLALLSPVEHETNTILRRSVNHLRAENARLGAENRQMREPLATRQWLFAQMPYVGRGRIAPQA